VTNGGVSHWEGKSRRRLGGYRESSRRELHNVDSAGLGVDHHLPVGEGRKILVSRSTMGARQTPCSPVEKGGRNKEIGLCRKHCERDAVGGEQEGLHF